MLSKYISSWISAFPRVEFVNLFEITIIAWIVYGILVWIKNTRAWVILRGLVFILGFTVVAAVFNFNTILWILGKIANTAMLVCALIFQPELRKALEQLGSGKLLKRIMPTQESSIDGLGRDEVEELITASFSLSKDFTGALIVIEQAELLGEYIKTGISIDGKLTSQLLINIFEHNTPLHDGAVIIRKNRIKSATCYLPLSQNTHISKNLGTRHRAAVGISEVTDSLTIVVSEETGTISVASRGALRKIENPQELRFILSALINEPVQTGWFSLWKGRKQNERKDNEEFSS